MKKLKCAEVVRQLLKENASVRDSDTLLIEKVYERYLGYPMKAISVSALLQKINEDAVPGIETVRRVRQRLQERHIELRGVLWEFRHKIEKTYVDQRL